MGNNGQMPGGPAPWSGPKLSPPDEEYLKRIDQVLQMPPRMTETPAEILPFLYLGNEQDARNTVKLSNLGVTGIVNAAAGYVRYQPNGREVLEIFAEDDDRYNITNTFAQAFEFIDRIQRQGGKVLVHCILGINRSAAIVVAYCLVRNRWKLIDAIRYVKEKREICLMNPFFRRQLYLYAKERQLL